MPFAPTEFQIEGKGTEQDRKCPGAELPPRVPICSCRYLRATNPIWHRCAVVIPGRMVRLDVDVESGKPKWTDLCRTLTFTGTRVVGRCSSCRAVAPLSGCFLF
ncbi:hypothetical protein VFPFJ_08548 [Purpureocillium lilacinum]|uniref:Uncharacterized protein n=1 Tax=Purpureocillium lilacinum TaxID=33203 RepID=A0A179GA01_PURLI|nr:hypothetical protein VFPFJ_08548 [Purpureocillium lilacinum]OAQ74642.1 hypothetical protein VFPBJ_09937 [Purpureocillium lilacinum]OAQ82745.1 hypothetical protein VFPFJ_08548 [Purpureocillium lilacinum]